MKQNSGNLPIIIGVSILSLTFFGLAGVGYSFYRNTIVKDETDSSELTQKDDDPFAQLKKEKNINIVPVPESTGGSSGIGSNSQAIPTGTYSNPPTTINSFGSSDVTRSTIDNLDSTRKSYQAIPDYSSPSSSNNFKRTNNNSLLESLEDDDLLDNSSTNRSDRLTTPPLTESPF